MNSMTPKSKCTNSYFRERIKGYEELEELALDLRWTWNHSTDKLWADLEPTLWEMTKNPWLVLQTVSREKLENRLNDPKFCGQLKEILEFNRAKNAETTWFQKNHQQTPLKSIAYFSMEYMLCEALPIYSGGLGNVAGDQLKSASDLGIPVVAVGLLYQQGYFRQFIDNNGSQMALYPYNDPGQLPITPLRRENGEWLRLEINLPGYSIWIRTWQVKVGRTHLYLLDSNDAANFPAYRGITSELYGGGPDLRIKQEMILGIGGWRLLNELGIQPQVCHLNEGHAAFAILERARSYMKTNSVPFDVALEVTRAGNLFTTHTAVAAGFDRFSPFIMQQHFERYVRNQLGISVNDLMGLGRQNPNDQNEFFNMAYLAIRGSGRINAVSRLHAQVSKQLFQPLFWRWPQSEVPISYVTNGVHMPTWDSVASDAVWSTSCGKNRWLNETEELQFDLQKVPKETLWEMRNANRKALIEFARNRLSKQLAASGAKIEDIEKAKYVFDPNVLTLGFARRFAAYKRPNMLLHNPERLVAILTNPQRPVQLIVAGKAHPADGIGQAMIQEWTNFIRRPEVKGHVMFLSDYDMNLTSYLVQGVDVWLNTPRRPWEACGTSGMKILVNGGLNLSELDGWWAEAYSPEVGWAIGDMQEHGENPYWDAVEANALYTTLERDVISQFYTRNSEGFPEIWTAKMRESMAKLTPKYSANRAVRQYTEEYYLPLADNFAKRQADQGKDGKQIVEWRGKLDKKWPSLKICDFRYATNESHYFFDLQACLDDLDPHAVRIELFAEGNNSSAPEIYEMEMTKQLPGMPGAYLYSAKIPAKRPANHFSPRIIPKYSDVAVPLEANHILWQH